VAHPQWLEVGYNLWAPIGPKDRDYFLPTPERCLGAFTRSPATEADMATLNKLVLQDLVSPLGASHPLVPASLLDGWTGHSERCTMPSVLAALGVPKGDRDLLGRWSPSGSDDYVRSYRAMVRSVMTRFRQALASKTLEPADEEEAVEEAGAFARRHGDQDTEQHKGDVEQLARAAAEFISAGRQGHAGRLDSPTEEPDEPDAVPSRTPVPPEGPPRGTAPGADTSEHEDDEDLAPVAPYLVGVHKGVRRLHRTGGCWAATVGSFARVEYIDMAPVPADMYTHVCKKCWPSGDPNEVGAVTSSASSGDESSDSKAP